MTRRQRRMAAIGTLLLGLAAAAVFAFSAFRQNMMYFYTPSDIAAGKVPQGAAFRIGGLVENGSVAHEAGGLAVRFVLGDCLHRVAVRYNGILPDLFREGQGIVATGRLTDGGQFEASEVLAKHDENYMPPQLAKSLKTTDGGHRCASYKSISSSPRPRNGGEG